MTNGVIGVRFPVPRREILEQIPETLRGLYGEQADPEPEEFSDEIDYLYEIKRPDGSPFEALLYCEYVLPGETPVVHVIDGCIELDGIAVEVVRSELFREGVEGDGRQYWRVVVCLPERGSDG